MGVFSFYLQGVSVVFFITPSVTRAGCLGSCWTQWLECEVRDGAARDRVLRILLVPLSIRPIFEKKYRTLFLRPSASAMPSKFTSRSVMKPVCPSTLRGLISTF